MRRLRWLSPLVVVLFLAGCGGDKGAGSTAAPASPAGGSPAASAPAPAPRPSNPRLILATTSSTVDSGLLDVLLPVFEQQTGYKVVPLSLGSGQALATAERGEADVLLVHSPDAEKAFVAAGHGIDRRLVMHNDFVVVGPEKDPAGIRGLNRASEALRRIAEARAPFGSRGDNSGTHALELKLWKAAGGEPRGQGWYIEAGAGIGQTLQIANDRQGYTISDRATYLNLRSKLQLTVLVERDPALLNIYHVIRVNPSKNERINADGAAAFADFMLSPTAQQPIGEYGKAKVGEPLFFPDAGKDEASLGS